jgi:hypothetical protein
MIMTKDIQLQADISKLLQDLVELDRKLLEYIDIDGYEDNSVTAIIERMKAVGGESSFDDPTHKEIYNRISTIVNNNEEIDSNIVFKNHSFNVEDIRDDFTAAAFFQDVSNGNIYFTARGTGPGRWVDNAILMFEESSQMMDETVKYFELVFGRDFLEDFLLARKNTDENNWPKLINSGHSRGGIDAQIKGESLCA